MQHGNIVAEDDDGGSNLISFRFPGNFCQAIVPLINLHIKQPRDHVQMTSGLSGGRGIPKSDVGKEVALNFIFSNANQSQIQTRGEGVKNPENFIDVICKWLLTLCRAHITKAVN